MLPRKYPFSIKPSYMFSATTFLMKPLLVMAKILHGLTPGLNPFYRMNN